MVIVDFARFTDSVEDRTLRNKMKGVISGITEQLRRMSHGGGANIIELLKNNQSDLGQLWPTLFLKTYHRPSYPDPNKNNLFFHVIKNAHEDARELAHYIVDNAPDDFLFRFKRMEHAPLVAASARDESVALKILGRLGPANLSKGHAMYQAALVEAQKNDFRDLIDAIELKIAYQPPAIVMVGRFPKPVDVVVELPDPREAINAAIKSGRISDALRVDDEVLRACTRFFESFQNHYAQTLTHAEDARQARLLLDERIDRLKAPIETLMEEVGLSPSTESVAKDLWFAVRKHVPWLDPRRSLEQGNIEITTATETALTKSYQLIDDCQSFAEAVPKVLSELRRLEESFADAVDSLDAQLQGELLDLERQQKVQLKSIFAEAKERALIMSGTMAIQDLANPSLLATEIAFASDLKNSMVAFSASATTAINSMALIKIGMTDQMRAEISHNLCAQWDKAEATLNLLKRYGGATVMLSDSHSAAPSGNFLELN